MMEENNDIFLAGGDALQVQMHKGYYTAFPEALRSSMKKNFTHFTVLPPA